jgi:phytol kinase
MIGAVAHDCSPLVLVSTLCAGFLGLAEGLRRLGCIHTEWTRKVAHVATGLVACAFPWLFDGFGSVLLLCGAFAAVLAWSQRAGWLPSVHAVARHSIGAVSFPAAVALVFLLTRGRPGAYVGSVLVLTVSDTLAALVGGAWGRHLYRVMGTVRSLEGSLAFLISAALCILAALLLLTPFGAAACVAWASIAALVATVLEATSPGGSDNLTVPVGTSLVLVGMALLG